jgi:NAD+ diphosphatase
MRDAEAVLFAGATLDRAAHLRGDAAALAELLRRPDARTLPVWRGKPLLGPGETLGWVAVDTPFVRAFGATPIFLGLEDGAPRFAHDVSDWEDTEADAAALGRFVDPSRNRPPGLGPGLAFAELRAVMGQLAAADAGNAAAAKGILGWHRTHGFCAACGAASTVDLGGWRRTCPACGTQHFPRTDPVVIMLITHGNAVLLGRSAAWPPRMFSLLAGFVEPGETIEAAVRRETFEETAVVLGPVGYLASQPWPFPSSLMIGCRAEALGRELRVDPEELEDARWFSREEVLDGIGARHPDLLPARRGAIARFLLERWLADRLE